MNYLVYAAGLIPGVLLFSSALKARLGPNPIEALTHRTGDWILWWLILTLIAAPLGRWTKRGELVRLRRPLGLLAFTYACAHLFIYAYLDKGLAWDEIGPDLAKRRFIWAGLAAFLCLLPLALTSTDAAIRKLGKRWKTLHLLVYPAALLGALHYYLLVKADVRWPLLYGAVFGAFVVNRSLRNRL